MMTTRAQQNVVPATAQTTKTAKDQQQIPTAQFQQKTAQAQRQAKRLTTQSQQKISRAAAQTTNCESLTGKSDSTTPTKQKTA
jgi:hypothetical protein